MHTRKCPDWGLYFDDHYINIYTFYASNLFYLSILYVKILNVLMKILFIFRKYVLGEAAVDHSNVFTINKST